MKDFVNLKQLFTANVCHIIAVEKQNGEKMRRERAGSTIYDV